MRLTVAIAILILASSTTFLASAEDAGLNSAGGYGALDAAPALDPQTEAPGDLLVYHRNARAPFGFTALAAAAGLNHKPATALPADLATYTCVVLPVNLRFTPEDQAALVTYVQGGGNLIAIGEYSLFAGSANAAMNGLAEALGSPLRVGTGIRDPGYRDTQNVQPTTLTLGVTKVRYAAYAPIAGSDGALVPELVRGADGTAFAAAQTVGAGLFTLMSDVNVLSDFNGNGFNEADNGRLGAQLCHGALALGLPAL